MSEEIASARYARALFELAMKENKLPEAEALLTEIAKVAKKHPEVMAIIQNPTLRQSEKSSFVEKIIPADSPALLKDFFKVLIEKKRFTILGDIQKEFHRLFEKKAGILEVEVLSAVPFSTALRDKLKKMLAAKLRSEIRIIPKTDASLLGGFLLRFGGKEIDCSFKNRIHEIEQQLITES